jgi:hypothetical protein
MLLCFSNQICSSSGLYIDIEGVQSCDVLPTLLSRKYFFTVVLAVVSFLATFGLVALTYEQTMNMLQNMVKRLSMNFFAVKKLISLFCRPPMKS